MLISTLYSIEGQSSVTLEAVGIERKILFAYGIDFLYRVPCDLTRSNLTQRNRTRSNVIQGMKRKQIETKTYRRKVLSKALTIQFR